jgi:signal transduction histidine kinase
MLYYMIRRYDIERSQASTALLDEKIRSEAIIAAIGDGISIQDTSFKVLYQNQVHKNIIGEHVGDYCYMAYEGRDNVCEGCPVEMSLKDGRIHTAERKSADNRTIVEVTASPLRDSTGKIIAGIEVVRNITERKSLEEQLRQAQKMEAIGQLTGGIAHDFNNILTAIIGYGSLMKMGMNEDNPMIQDVEQILASAEKAASLTRQLLAFSRKQIINPKPVNLNEIISRLENLLTRLIGEDIHLKTILSEDDLTVMADSGQIEQVLMNLATNARDAMPRGGVLAIETGLVQLGSEYIKTNDYVEHGEYALISVSDTGMGMDNRTIDRIFEPFFTTKELGKGTGLGLAVSYGIIKQHNGYINVYSEPAKGTIFKIYLPIVKSEVLDR